MSAMPKKMIKTAMFVNDGVFILSLYSPACVWYSRRMNIVFSDHALLKMRQRKLSKRTVLAVIAKPDQAEKTYSGREELYKKFRKRSLKVVIVRTNNRIIIVTAHWV